MVRACVGRCLGAWLTLSVCGATSLAAQSIHMPPPEFPSLPFVDGPDTVRTLMTIRAAAPESVRHALVRGSQIRSFGGKLWIIAENGSATPVELRGRTIRDIANEINANYQNAIAIPLFPEYDGRYLKGSWPTPLDTLPALIGGDLGGPHIAVTLGAVFGLSEVQKPPKENNLLSNGGFQADLIAQQALQRRWFLRLRATFATSDPQTVKSEDGGGEAAVDSTAAPGTPPPDLQGIIQGTERFSMGGIVDLLLLDRSRLEVALTFDGEVAWSAFDFFELPDSVRFANDSVRALDQLYPADRISEVSKQVNRILPTSHMFAGSWVHFTTAGLSAHALGALGLSEIVERRVAIGTSEDPRPTDLFDNSSAEYVGVWRLGLGMTVGPTLEFRADGIGPINRKSNFDPVLRLYLSKSINIRDL